MKKIIFVFLFVLATVVILPTESFAQTIPWADSTMNYRHQITINSSQVSGNTNLINFPTLISIQNGLNLNSNNIQSNGADIRFYDNSGNNLDFEIESFSTNPTSGSLTAWVKLPSLSATTDTILWLYHGNTIVTDAQNPGAVWGDYQAVYHMETLTESVTGQTAPSPSGNISHPNGKVGKSASFANGAFVTGNGIDGRNGYSISGWLTLPTSDDFGNSNIVVNNHQWLRIDPDGEAQDRLALFTTDGASLEPRVGITYTTDTLFHFAYTWDSSTGQFKSYRDGVLQQTVTRTATLPAPDATTNIRNYDSKIIDELQFRGSVKSADWITAEYSNQNSPDTFLSISAMENRPITSTTTQTTNQNSSNTIDSGLFILMLIISLLCFVLSIKYGTALLFITIILTLSLGIALIAGYDVVTVETTTVNEETFTTTKCLICNNGEWLGWSLFLFGMLSSMFFLLQTFRGR